MDTLVQEQEQTRLEGVTISVDRPQRLILDSGLLVAHITSTATPTQQETPLLGQPKQAERIPRLVPPSRDIKTGIEVQELVQVMWAITISRALQSGFPVERGEIALSENEHSGRRRLILNVYTPANTAQTLAFWDSLDRDFRRWLSRLSEALRMKVHSETSLHFQWSGP